MKLCFVHISQEEGSEAYFSLVGTVFRKVLGDSSEVHIKAVRPGFTRVMDGAYAYFNLLNTRQVIEKLVEAEREKFDAAVVGCFLDPGVREAREIVKMPVIGLGESTMHLACQLGYRFAIVIPKPPPFIEISQSATWENLVRWHGLQGRALPSVIKPISTSAFDVFTKGVKDPGPVALDVQNTAKQCVQDGADVVVCGCAALGPICSVSNVARVEESGAPILDCVAVGLKTAQLIVDLHTALDMPYVSRAGMYAQPKEKDLRRVRATFGLESN